MTASVQQAGGVPVDSFVFCLGSRLQNKIKENVLRYKHEKHDQEQVNLVSHREQSAGSPCLNLAF
jgi:hypothetical protein